MYCGLGDMTWGQGLDKPYGCGQQAKVDGQTERQGESHISPSKPVSAGDIKSMIRKLTRLGMATGSPRQYDIDK